MSEEKKGITVKIDAALHAEVRQYLEEHGMTMGEFIALAVDNELHPKMEMEEKEMGKMRTLAFQVTEELFQKIKQYLLRNNMTQKEFVIGLIEAELDREQTEREAPAEEIKETDAEETNEEEFTESEEAQEPEDSEEMEDDIEAGEDTEEDEEPEEDEDFEEEEEDEDLEESGELEEDEEPEEAEEQAMGMSM